jgi:drug/metabolite transporter (DMT)-like permease
MTSVALAVLAGMLFAWAAGLQQQAGRASLGAMAPLHHGRLQRWLPITGVVRRMLRNRGWLLGWAVNLAGFLAQAVALHFGSVSVVQPVLVTQLLFTIPIAAVHTGCRPSITDFVSGGAVCVGVGLFVANWSTHSDDIPVDRSRAAAAVASGLGLAILLVARTARLPSADRAIFTAVAAGLSFAVSAVLMKLTFDSLLGPGVLATATDWTGYLLAVSTGLGLIIGQDALASGALSMAVAGMTITNPLASAAIGVLAFHEPIQHSAAAWTGLSISGALLVGGVIGLARSATIRADARDSAAHRVANPKHSVGSWTHGLPQSR